MLFNSLHFLVFFPIVTLFYFILPHKVRWVWLLAASYYFYMSWNARYALLMALSTAITYLSGLLLNRSNSLSDSKKRGFERKLWVALSFSLNLAILFFFKYFNFALTNINAVLSRIGVTVIDPAFDVLLPVGISFYTFQALSYTMDVYRGEIHAEKNFFKYALFVSFFPQLVAGPIERSKNLLLQINEKHSLSYGNLKNGLLLMLWGYFQKIAVADRVAVLVNEVYENHMKYAGVHVLLATLLFAVQIYCDFSAYSDIARGAAQILGFKLMENFRQPYFAVSVRDFWRRWHISLSTWFRDYLYIPMGGSRCGVWKKRLNLMVTFLVSGLWHGASWNFVVWGGLHGAYQIIGDILEPFRRKVVLTTKMNTEALPNKLFKGVITFALVNFAWVFFRAPGISEAISIINRMLTGFNLAGIMDKSILQATGYDKYDLVVIPAMLLVFLFVEIFREKTDVFKWLERQKLWFRWPVYIGMFYCVLFVAILYASGVSQEFIYFQF